MNANIVRGRLPEYYRSKLRATTGVTLRRKVVLVAIKKGLQEAFFTERVGCLSIHF